MAKQLFSGPRGTGSLTRFLGAAALRAQMLAMVLVASPVAAAADQAPAPPAPPPSSVDPPPGAPASSSGPSRGRFAVAPRAAFRVGDADKTTFPTVGFGLGGTVELDYLRGAAGWEAAVGVDFGFDRFRTDERGMVLVDGMPQTFAATRVLSETSFLLVHTLAGRLGVVRPFVSVGAGIGLAYFDSVEQSLQPGTARETHLLGRASLGLDIAVTGVWGATIRGDYTAVRGTSAFHASDGRTLRLFGDLAGVGAGIAYRF